MWRTFQQLCFECLHQKLCVCMLDLLGPFIEHSKIASRVSLTIPAQEPNSRWTRRSCSPKHSVLHRFCWNKYQLPRIALNPPRLWKLYLGPRLATWARCRWKRQQWFLLARISLLVILLLLWFQKSRTVWYFWKCCGLYRLWFRHVPSKSSCRQRGIPLSGTVWSKGWSAFYSFWWSSVSNARWLQVRDCCHLVDVFTRIENHVWNKEEKVDIEFNVRGVSIHNSSRCKKQNRIAVSSGSMKITQENLLWCAYALSSIKLVPRAMTFGVVTLSNSVKAWQVSAIKSALANFFSAYNLSIRFAISCAVSSS